MTTLFRSLMIRTVGMTLGLTVVSFPAMTHAQGTPIQIDMNSGLGQALGQALQASFGQGMSKLVNNAVTVSPDSQSVDPSAKKATIKLVNPGDDSAYISLRLRDSKEEPQPSAEQASAGFVEDSATKPAPAAHLLKPWVKNLPKELVLAPHETREIPVTLDVPATAEAGTYTTYVVVSTTKLVDSKGAQGNFSVQADASNGDGVPMIAAGGKTNTHFARLAYQVK